MIRRLYQRLSDPIFYRRRWVLFRNRYKNVDFREGKIGEIPHQRVMIVIAHPDDEVFCSGIICELVEKYKSEIRILCLTRGEGGPLPEGITRDQLGEIREAEMHKSCKILGVSRLRFLDHEDPVGDEFRTYAPDVSCHELAIQLIPYFRRFEPDIIITHGSWGEYWHPAHLLVRSAVMRAAKSKTILTFQAQQDEPEIPEISNQGDPPHLKFDFSHHFEKRLAALESHESQLNLFAAFANGTHIDFVKKTSREHLSIARLRRRSDPYPKKS